MAQVEHETTTYAAFTLERVPRLLAIALAAYLLLAAGAAAAPITVGEVDGPTVAPVFAGNSIAWVGNFGYCIPDAFGASPSYCVQYLAKWHGGKESDLAVFRPARFDSTPPFGVAPVVALAGSSRLVAYERSAEYSDIRETYISGQEFGTVVGRKVRRLHSCNGGQCACESPSVAVSGRVVATPMGPRGRAGIFVRDLARRKTHRFRAVGCAKPALAGRYLAAGYPDSQAVRVYDWRRERLVKVVRTPRHYYVGDYALQSDGTVAVSFISDVNDTQRLVVATLRSKRPRVVSREPLSTVHIARNRLAYDGGRRTLNFVVKTLRGKTVSRVIPPAGATLTDFDGRCLLYTVGRPRHGLYGTTIFTEPVGAPAGPCSTP
jgi:hypothetical protein